jgi:hypothetical protein
MRISFRFTALSLSACCLLAATSNQILAQAAAQPAKPAVGSTVPPAAIYGKLLSGIEAEFVSAAEAMPAEKYDFAPPATAGEFKGVRTFGEQVKHVTEANEYYLHDPAAPLADNRAAIDKLKTKDEIVAALKQSFVGAHKLVDSMTAQNAFVMTESGTRAGMASMGIAHMLDHYGQMVEYLRMNGIIPPASRGSM